MSEFARFATLLLSRGFHKTYDSRAGGCRMVEWTKNVDANRKLDLQIWAHGKHRISHWIGGRMTTPPTYFHDEASMDRAIHAESTRRDNENLEHATPQNSEASDAG